MTTFRTIIDAAVTEAMLDRPKYFSEAGHAHARKLIVGKIMAALRGDTKSGAQPLDDPPAVPVATLVEPQSREARAFRCLREVAGAVPPPRCGDGRIIVNPEVLCPAALAFADCPPTEAWLFVSEARQIGAWSEFFRETLPDIPKKPILTIRDGQSGICVPWPWPPAKDGRTYEAAA